MCLWTYRAPLLYSATCKPVVQIRIQHLYCCFQLQQWGDTAKLPSKENTLTETLAKMSHSFHQKEQPAKNSKRNKTKKDHLTNDQQTNLETEKKPRSSIFNSYILVCVHTHACMRGVHACGGHTQPEGASSLFLPCGFQVWTSDPRACW